MHTPYLKQCWENMRYNTVFQKNQYDVMSDDELLEKDRFDTPVWKTQVYGLRQARQRRVAYGGAFILIMIFLGSLLAHHPTHITQPLQDPTTSYLRLLAPTTQDLLIPKASLNHMMCKSILSSLATGYPAPLLINYNVSVEKNFFSIAGGTHMLKIKGVRDYLNKLDPQYDNDVVIVYDATDTWFQLPPEILLSRYLQLRRDANARLPKKFGRAAHIAKMSEQVFFSVQKGCGITKSQHSASGCHAAPDSSLPKDIYGPGTDGPAPSGEREFVLKRPRWVNSGFAIGTVGAMRPVYNMAFWLQYHGIGRENGGSDQFVITELVGMQNAWRHQQAEKYRTWTDRISAWASKLVGHADEPAKEIDWHSIYNITSERTYELGLGLDEASRLSQVTWSFEKELEWTTHDDPSSLEKLYQDRHLTPFSSKAATLPHDLRDIRTPFAQITPTPKLDSSDPAPAIPTNETWVGVPLVTNLYTGDVPASFHMCGVDWKYRISTHWKKPWFYPRIRKLLDASAAPAGPSLGVTEVDGKRTEWFARGMQGALLATDRTPRNVPFAQVCGSHWDELLGDEKGDWVNPSFESLSV